MAATRGLAPVGQRQNASATFQDSPPPFSFLPLNRGKLMGVTISSLWSSLSSLATWGKDKDVRILMLGLDAAGKTTILYRLQVRERWSNGAPGSCLMVLPTPVVFCLDW